MTLGRWSPLVIALASRVSTSHVMGRSIHAQAASVCGRSLSNATAYPRSAPGRGWFLVLGRLPHLGLKALRIVAELDPTVAQREDDGLSTVVHRELAQD